MKNHLIRFSQVVAAAALFTPSIYAGENHQMFQTTTVAQSADLYRANEFQVDLFGVLAFSGSESRHLFDDDTGGGGVAFNYFVNRYVGFGVEGTFYDTEGDTAFGAAFNVYLRYPIANSGLAFYTLAGAGVLSNVENIGLLNTRDRRDADDTVFMAHVGAGIEYRFTRNVSIFSDARYTFTDRDDSDFFSGRVGLRFAF